MLEAFWPYPLVHGHTDMQYVYQVPGPCTATKTVAQSAKDRAGSQARPRRVKDQYSLQLPWLLRPHRFRSEYPYEMAGAKRAAAARVERTKGWAAPPRLETEHELVSPRHVRPGVSNRDATTLAPLRDML